MTNDVLPISRDAELLTERSHYPRTRIKQSVREVVEGKRWGLAGAHRPRSDASLMFNPDATTVGVTSMVALPIIRHHLAYVASSADNIVGSSGYGADLLSRLEPSEAPREGAFDGMNNDPVQLHTTGTFLDTIRVRGGEEGTGHLLRDHRRRYDGSFNSRYDSRYDSGYDGSFNRHTIIMLTNHTDRADHQG